MIPDPFRIARWLGIFYLTMFAVGVLVALALP